MNPIWKLILTVLLLLNISILFSYYSSNKRLKIIACDVGQGDGIIITHLSNQVVIDGGPSDRIINCLSKYTPFWDRKIELVILTHPEADHFTGLIEVVKHYKVDNFMENGLGASNENYRLLIDEVQGRGIKRLSGVEVQSLSIGLIHLDILYPDGITSQIIKNINSGQIEVKDIKYNEYSLVALLSLNSFEALLTSDINQDISNNLQDIIKNKYGGEVDYIKIPHHGSKTGLTEDFFENVHLSVAVISAGKNNSYGHPHKEVLDMLDSKGIKILRTDLVGDVVIETDGSKVWYKD